MQKNLLILALTATAVVTLGFVSVAHHNRSELLVGSQAKRGRTAQVAAPKKGLVGSTTVRPGQGSATPGIGNQAAPQGHMNPGTNIVFKNVFNEGGVVRAKRAQASMKKGLVGSTQVVDPNNDPRKRSAPPISIGNQAASQAGSGFFTQAKRGRTAQVAAPKKGLVGSTTVGPGQGSATPGIGNQAAPQGHMNPGTNIVFHNVFNEGGVVRARK